MGRTEDSKIKYFDGDEYTCITFQPDLAKFKMSMLDKDTVALMTRRAYDIAGSTKGVRVYFNGKKLPVRLRGNGMQMFPLSSHKFRLLLINIEPCSDFTLWLIRDNLLYPQVTGFRSYVDMYVKDKVDELGESLTVIHEIVNDRWEVCLTMSEKGFQQVSFVNSIATTKVTVYQILFNLMIVYR